MGQNGLVLNNYYALGPNLKETGELGKSFWKALNLMITEFKKSAKLTFGWINRKCTTRLQLFLTGKKQGHLYNSIGLLRDVFCNEIFVLVPRAAPTIRE